MKNKNKYALIIVVLLILSGAFIALIPLANNKIMMRQAARAAGAMPYQIGIVNATVTQCTPSCCSPAGCRCCTGGTLCLTIMTEPQCPLHSDVMGAQAGGMGSNALFLNTQIAKAGLSSGGQLIAGGMGPTLMDSGVLASKGGCSGCMAKATILDNLGGVYDYIIASFRED